MVESNDVSRRRALGLGAGLIGFLALSRSSLASASVSGSTQPSVDDSFGCWPGPHGPCNPYNEPNLGIGRTVAITNGSFEEGAPGLDVPGWTIRVDV